jgi:hypothetical protein
MTFRRTLFLWPAITLAVIFASRANAQITPHLAIVAGDGQTAAVNTPFPQALTVKLTDDFGHPLPGARVVFENNLCLSAESSGCGGTSYGHFDPNGYATTDAMGIAVAPPYIAASKPGIASVLAAPVSQEAPYGFTISATIHALVVFQTLTQTVPTIPTLARPMLAFLVLVLAVIGCVSVVFRGTR